MKYFMKKLFALIITLLLVSFLAFLAFSIIPGDPTTRMLGTQASQEAIEELRAQLGLNEPVVVRYLNWLSGFIRGDYGISYSYSMPVRDMIQDKLPITALLTGMTFLLTVLFSVPLGILAGNVKSESVDRIVTALDQVLMSIPSFFIGIVSCYVLGLEFKWFVPGEFVSYRDSFTGFLSYMIYPAMAIAIPYIAMTVKLLRSSILGELGQDYVRTSRSRGNDMISILFRDVLRNALLPVITFLAVSLAEMMTGTIIIEQVFTVPGIGRLLMSSINNRDYPVVQAIVVILAGWIVLVNYLGDILTQLADPRIRNR